MMQIKFNFNNFAPVCHSLAACQRHTPSSLAAVFGLSNNDVISLRSLRCVRCAGWKPRFRLVVASVLCATLVDDTSPVGTISGSSHLVALAYVHHLQIFFHGLRVHIPIYSRCTLLTVGHAREKLSYFSNPTFHRHLAPFRTDFTDTRTALYGFFLCFSFFLVFSYRFFLPF